MNRLSSIVVLSLTLFGPATAHGAPNPCFDDIKKFCTDVQPGGGRMMNCLQQHQQQISPDCRKHWVDNVEAIVDVRLACANDVEHFCGDKQVGGGDLLRCLRSHKSDVSSECQTEIAEYKENRR